MKRREERMRDEARESCGSLRGVTSEDSTKKGLSESTTESECERYDSSVRVVSTCDRHDG
jgi:hypothetical protein